VREQKAIGGGRVTAGDQSATTMVARQRFSYLNRHRKLYTIDITMRFAIRRMIAGLLAWMGKVTLLFTLVVAGIGVAAHVWLRLRK
jgi:hypothetical protein